ncbi:MAG: hypothetical protein J2P54_20720, partial [Bradyrhizobiaceae bacterium]|nr:hypothetical protein [Bradyrhizobiaceae bacterium]
MPTRSNLGLASFESGTISHIAGMLLKREDGIKWRTCPIAGSRPMMVDLLAGQVQAGLDSLQRNSDPSISRGRIQKEFAS